MRWWWFASAWCWLSSPIGWLGGARWCWWFSLTWFGSRWWWSCGLVCFGAFCWLSVGAFWGCGWLVVRWPVLVWWVCCVWSFRFICLDDLRRVGSTSLMECWFWCLSSRVGVICLVCCWLVLTELWCWWLVIIVWSAISRWCGVWLLSGWFRYLEWCVLVDWLWWCERFGVG